MPLLRPLAFLLLLGLLLPRPALSQLAGFQKISALDGGFDGPLADEDLFGSALTGLGDLDGDGTPDLAAGAPGGDGAGTNQGAVWILFLHPDGSVKSHQKISALDGGFGGPLVNNVSFGEDLAGLGDLDGDGTPDLAVGAVFDRDGGPAAGAVWILFLHPDGSVKSHQKISALDGGLDGPLDPTGFFGAGLAAPGDLDGDGTPDLAVGAPREDGDGLDRGAVRILFLNPDCSVKATTRIGAPGDGLLADNDEFGAALAGLGDFDGDGTPDLAAGAPGDQDSGSARGAVWILFLNPDGSVKDHRKISATTGNFTGVLDRNDRFGQSLAFPGDLDGDGLVELAVGAPQDDDGLGNQGAVWMLSLAPGGTVQAFEKISDTIGGVEGTLNGGDFFGEALAAPGDLDGDGVPDLAAGADGDDSGGPQRGAVWVLRLEGTVLPPPDDDRLVTGFTLIDADTDLPVPGFDPITAGATLDVPALPPRLSIRANVEGDVESVWFALDEMPRTRVESVAPYALFGDGEGNYAPGTFTLRTHVLSATPYSQDHAGGEAGPTATLTFTVHDSRLPDQPVVTGFFLVDPATGQDLRPLADGDTLNLDLLPPELNVRAAVSSSVSHVRFELAPDGYTRIEVVPPFALFGDLEGRYLGQNLSAGSYVLMATPFAGTRRSAQAGGPSMLHLEATGTSSARLAPPAQHIAPAGTERPVAFELEVNYPNPFNPTTHIGFSIPESSPVRLTVFDALGRPVATLADGPLPAGRHMVTFDAVGLPSGPYFYRLETPYRTLSRSMILTK